MRKEMKSLAFKTIVIAATSLTVGAALGIALGSAVLMALQAATKQQEISDD